MGDVREIIEDNMRNINEVDIREIRSGDIREVRGGDIRETRGGDIREIRGGDMPRQDNSLRSNEELRKSGMMDEDFYLNSTDASSIRDRNNAVIGQWI